jgi:hypothetical protein
VELGEREFTGPIDCHEEIEPAFGGANLSDVDVKIADWIGFEFASRGLVAFDLWQSRDAMSLQAAVQSRPGQVRDGELQGIQAVIGRQ